MRRLSIVCGVLLALTPLVARAQAPVTTADLEDCTWAWQPEDDRALVYVCTFTDGGWHVFVQGSSQRVVAYVYDPSYGMFFTPQGRERLPRTWRRWAAAGVAHALQPTALDQSGCPDIDAYWAGHIVYAATVGWPGRTVSVWVAPDGMTCWIKR